MTLFQDVGAFAGPIAMIVIAVSVGFLLKDLYLR